MTSTDAFQERSSAGERGARMIEELEAGARSATPDAVASLVTRAAERAGIVSAVLFLADLQQVALVPLTDGKEDTLAQQLVDSTLAGLAYQRGEAQEQSATDADPSAPEGSRRRWVPVVSGSERLGVLAVTMSAELARDEDFAPWVHRLAGESAHLVLSQQLYGDTIVALRRTRDMDVAAEMQWGLLPPLSFVSDDIGVAGALEPAYQIAGDSLDYAVGRGLAQLAVVDAMGHGLESALLVSVAVNAYRKARRSGAALVATITEIERALTAGFGTDRFVTGVFAELDTRSGIFTWVNAGHHPPLLFRGAKLVKSLDAPPRWPLGLAVGDGAIVTASEKLEQGDLVLMFTDGVTEARSPDGEFYGLERLTDVVSQQLAGGLEGPETMRRVVRALLEHQQGRLQDDATLLLVQWRPNSV